MTALPETRFAKTEGLDLQPRLLPIRDCPPIAEPTSGTAGKRSEREFLFQSPQMQQLMKLAARYARSSAAVMVTGESGTGKELVSRYVHETSDRRGQRLVSVNCAALPELLFESEFFGHSRGAFTGAVQDRPGYFERADGGTLLLDEISEVPLALQAKLLRVIEEQEVQRVGSDRPRKIDVRIIATSNRDLSAEVRAGRFRQDLFFRLNVLKLHIPPLRQRTTDIPLLVSHFVERFRSENERPVQGVTRDAMKQLSQYHWPGNVRELRNVIHRACIICDQTRIDSDCLIGLEESVREAIETGWAIPAGMTLAEIEHRAIQASLERHRGNKTAAAAELGVTARTLRNKLKKDEVAEAS